MSRLTSIRQHSNKLGMSLQNNCKINFNTIIESSEGVKVVLESIDMICFLLKVVLIKMVTLGQCGYMSLTAEKKYLPLRSPFACMN